MTTETCPTVQAWEDAGRPHPYATFRAGYDVAVTNFLETTGQYVTNDASREAAIKEAVELDRQSRGEAVAFPSANLGDAAKGWFIDYRFLEQVERLAASRTDYSTSMEATEQVLIAASELLRSAPQPAEPVVNQSLTTVKDGLTGDERAALETALSELIDKIIPGLDTGDILADARLASASLAQPTAQQSLQVAEPVKCQICQDSGIIGHGDICPCCQDTWQPKAEPVKGEPSDMPDGFGSAQHWKEKAQYWASEVHKLRGQALRGEPVDGIISPHPVPPSDVAIKTIAFSMCDETSASGEAQFTNTVSILAFGRRLLDLYQGAQPTQLGYTLSDVHEAYSRGKTEAIKAQPADSDFWPVDEKATRKNLIAQIGQMNYRLTALKQENEGLKKHVTGRRKALRNYQKAQPAASAKPITAEQILSLERRSHMTDDEALRFARSVESLIHRVAPVAAQPEPLHITHAPLMCYAAVLLRLRKPVTPDFEQAAADLERAVDGYPTPGGEPSPQWLEVAAKAEQDHFRDATEKVAAQPSVPESAVRVLNKLWEAIQGMERMPTWEEVNQARRELGIVPSPTESSQEGQP